MGASAPGALNAQGFTQAISAGQLPDYTHITHSGIFNQFFFQVGDQAKKLLEIYHGLAVSNCDLYDMDNRNYFLSLFVKSSTDGKERTQPLNVAIALDVSGSMDGALKYNPNEIYNESKTEKSRIQLAKKAILMLFDKLKGDDVFSLVTFHTSAKTIIESSFVKDLDRAAVETLVNSKFESGGTTVATGFNEAKKNISNFRKDHSLENYQHRIVMLTDVGDNSVAGQQKLIQDISDTGISTTIIGVSTDFKSQTCQKLIKVKGFNYLCAVQNQDLQTYLVDQFDYTFFPCVQDSFISLRSDLIKQIEVYGSVDHDVKYDKEGNCFTVTKMKSGFPSALTINKQDKPEMKGGLILVKFKPKQVEGLPRISLTIDVTYADLKGDKFTQSYPIDKTIQAEEYYSHQAIKKGVQLFYYTQTIRNLLKDMRGGQKALSDANKGFYRDKLQKLKGYCPVFKMKELEDLIKIVKEKNEVKQQ